MPALKTRGCCVHCNKDFPSTGMGQHLAACLGTGPALHIAVDVGPGTWWMHLALAPSATLRHLDDFLRATWLECCGHLSGFDIGGVRFESSLGGAGEYWGAKPRSMAAKTSTVLPVGSAFGYEYDFGSTTTLRGRVIGRTPTGAAKVTLLARNEPILWPCATCRAPATRICPFCGLMGCAACKSPCGCLRDFAEESLPVVNSPRMGVCAYSG